MKKAFLLSVSVLAVLFLAGCALCGSKPENSNPKYVFLFIGDGMGKQHVDLARQTIGPLNMDRLPVRGSVSTVNVSKRTTDSAASGTAFACGIKTDNGRLGTDPNGNPVDSNAVFAKRQGRMVAILTTVGVNNATPGAFYAHVASRGESKKIVEQFPASGFDLLIGEGIDGWNSKIRQSDFENGNAYRMPKTQGSADSLNGKGILLLAKDHNTFFAMEKLTSPVFLFTPDVHFLQKYVQKSIELMQDCPNGFFMMAEGGHIDHGGHGNNGQYMLGELKEFDLAIGKALEFYKKHPKETLIIVSADHHTGGLRLSGTPMKNYPELTMEKMNLSIGDSLEETLKKLELSGIRCDDKEIRELKKIMQSESGKKKNEIFSKFIRNTVDKHSGISWLTRGHTADEVYLFAIGAGAEKFTGKQENSDVGAKLKAIFSR